MAGEFTTKDALIAEMLGDVLKLHDSIEGLKSELPALADEFAKTVKPQVDAMLLAATAVKTEILTAQNSAVATVKQTSDRAAEAARLEVRAALTIAAQEAIAAAIAQQQGDITKSTKEMLGKLSSATSALKQATAASYSDRLKRAGVIAAACIASGLIAVAAGRMATPEPLQAKSVSALTPEQAKALSDGQALQYAWPRLDNKTKKLIQAAMAQ